MTGLRGQLRTSVPSDELNHPRTFLSCVHCRTFIAVQRWQGDAAYCCLCPSAKGCRRFQGKIIVTSFGPIRSGGEDALAMGSVEGDGVRGEQHAPEDDAADEEGKGKIGGWWRGVGDESGG